MKLGIHSILCLALAATTFACSKGNLEPEELPSVVRNALHATYPAIKEIEWEQTRNGFEAEFDTRGREIVVLIDTAGRVLGQKQEISLNDLSPELRRSVQHTAGGYRIDNIEMVTMNGIAHYQAVFKGNRRQAQYMVFNEQGIEEKTIAYWD